MPSEQFKPPVMEQSVPVHFPHWRRRAYAIFGLLVVFGVGVTFATTICGVQIPFLTEI